jgi:hypothetical protein
LEEYLKKAVSMPNVNTTLIKATNAISLVKTPYSAVLKVLMVCRGTSKKLSILGKILPNPYKTVSPASFFSLDICT